MHYSCLVSEYIYNTYSVYTLFFWIHHSLPSKIIGEAVVDSEEWSVSEELNGWLKNDIFINENFSQV